MKPIIEIENLGKLYQLGELLPRYVSLRDEIAGLFRKRAKKAVKDSIWALREVSFQVHPGERIAVIGNNGAGKSTLLKVLAKITPPTEGSLTVRGRVGSLLEVGTGFHPELTGRENIYFNGSVLGLTRREINQSFAEIVEFSGVPGKFLDTPLKHYSSGMQLRLAFSVAAHLKPEILFIDEVLAVGDAEFQKKCLGKMEEIGRSGRTILFVSHNLAAVRSLCSRGLLLEDGRLVMDDRIEKVIPHYLNRMKSASPDIRKFRLPDMGRQIEVTNIRLGNDPVSFGAPLSLDVSILPKISTGELFFGVTVFNDLGQPVAGCLMRDKFAVVQETPKQVRIILRELNLAPGSYYFSLGLGKKNESEILDSIIGYPRFEVLPPGSSSGEIARWNPRWGNIVISSYDFIELK